MFVIILNTFIVVLGIGLLIPILPKYVEPFGVSGKTLGLINAMYPIAQFLFSRLGGRLCDIHGRKIVILISLLGYAFSQILFGMASSLWLIFVSRFLSGVSAAGFLPAAMAYITDITKENNRTRAMGLFAGAFTLAYAIAPGIGGYLALVNMRFPFIFAGIAGFVACILTLLILPETLTVDQLKKNKLVSQVKISVRDQILRVSKTDAFVLLVLVFTMSFGLSNFSSIVALYSYEVTGLTTMELSALITFVSILGVIIQVVLLDKLTKKYGEFPILQTSFAAATIGFIMLIVLKGKILFSLSAALFFVFMSLLRPILNTLISKSAGKDKGEVMGLNNMFMSLGNSIGPIVSGMLFDVKTFMPFLFGSVIMVFSLFILRYSTRKSESRLLDHAS